MRRRSSGNPRQLRGRCGSALLVACGWLLAGAALASAPGPPEEPAQPAPGERAAMPPAPAAAAIDPDATLWQSLRYEGAALVGEFSALLELDAAAESASPTPRWVAALRTRMRSALLPDKETTVRAWFDPLTAAVDRFEKLKLGPGPSYKRFLLRDDGVERFRKEPGFGEDPRRHETWRSEKRTFLPFEAAAHGCRLVSDPGALVYLVSFGPGRWGEDPGACVVSGRTLYRVSMREAGGTTLDVRYRLRGADASQSVRAGRARLARYEVVGTPVAGELDEEVARIDILVDPATQLPWKVVVREGPFQLDVELTEAVLRSSGSVSR